MKKIVLLLVALLLTVTVMAVAEPVTALDLVVIEEPTPAPYDWSMLGTVAGATAATLLIVQYLKIPLDRVWKIPTRIFVYLIATAILVCAKAFSTGITYADVPLLLLNAFVVALAAMGAYEATFARLAPKGLEPPT